MTHHISTAIDLTTSRYRRRSRPLPPLACVPDERTAEAMDDERAAEELMNDLVTLVEAGLIAPVEYDDAIRYAPADAEDVAA